MNTLVIDCSISLSWCLPDEITEKSISLLKDAMRGKCQLIQPELWWYEMINGLRSAVARKRITPTGAEKALHFLGKIPIHTVSTGLLEGNLVLDCALRHKLSAYDASYVVLAQSRRAALITNNNGLLRLAPEFSNIKSLDKFNRGHIENVHRTD
jgi:predicted nucleic acid-binding protein